MNAPVIGIDIGGPGIKGGLVDPGRGKLLGEPVCVPTPQPATPKTVAQLVAELSVYPKAPAAVGVTIPGINRHGVVHFAANMDRSWLNTDINELLTTRLGRGWRSSMTTAPPALPKRPTVLGLEFPGLSS